MSTGVRRMIINNRERLISDDHNRLQDFVGAHMDNVQRRALCTRPNSGPSQALETGSYLSTEGADASVIATPLKADVIEGLVVMPENSSLRLLVSPGVIGVDDPDGQAGSSDPSPPSADDSRYKMVVDPGVQAFGVLAMTAGGVATRVDLIECRRKTLVTQQQSRDVYNVTTGLFTASLVDKVQEDQLEYRVRQGTPGAGIPALAQGWLPICVAVVPTSATTNDGITFYDVRPLVKDRVNAPFEGNHISAYYDNSYALYANDHTDPAKTLLVGIASSSIGMYRCGGLMPLGPAVIDLRDPINQAAGYAPTAGLPYFIYSVFPAGLPRWVKYLPAPATRIPSGPLGLVVVSDAGAGFQFGTDAVVNPPPASGLVTSGPAALLCAGVITPGGDEAGFVANNREVFLSPDTAASGFAPSATSAVTDTYDLGPNGNFPETARAVYVTISATLAGVAGTADFADAKVYVFAPGTTTRVALVHNTRFNYVYLAGGAVSLIFSCWVPVIPFGTLTGEASETLRFSILWGNAVAARTLSTARVYGWRL